MDTMNFRAVDVEKAVEQAVRGLGGPEVERIALERAADSMRRFAVNLPMPRVPDYLRAATGNDGDGAA